MGLLLGHELSPGQAAAKKNYPPMAAWKWVTERQLAQPADE